MADRKLLVTHHAPDLDACGAVWLFKRFDSQHFADAKVAFVNPGETITTDALAEYEVDQSQVIHVDTGLGEFDHHQAERGLLPVCASSLVHEHIQQIHPELSEDKPLQVLIDFITEIDHFREIDWPDSGNYRYSFMLNELIRGLEFSDPHNDDSQLHFGLTCLDSAYAVLTQQLKAEQIIQEKGQEFMLPMGKCLGLETRNDDTIKVAQKQGYMLVIRKDAEEGLIRIKARPDCPIDLKPLADKIKEKDSVGSWFYHASGKMLLNGSHKHRDQTASPLSLDEVIALTKEVYGHS